MPFVFKDTWMTSTSPFKIRYFKGQNILQTSFSTLCSTWSFKFGNQGLKFFQRVDTLTKDAKAL
jgi:hypothetical protein